MAQEQQTTNSPDKSWFSDISWKTSAVIAALSMVTGGGAGAGIVATKAVAAAPTVPGLTQDQADVRYVTKEAAEQVKALRERQFDAIDKKMLSRDVYEAYHKNDVERMDRIEKMLDLILQNQRVGR